MMEGDTAETQQQHDGVVQGAPSHHRAQGASFNPFGGHPPLSDFQKPDAIMKIIAAIFLEIAIVFHPAHYSATEQILNTKVQELVERLLHDWPEAA